MYRVTRPSYNFDVLLGDKQVTQSSSKLSLNPVATSQYHLAVAGGCEASISGGPTSRPNFVPPATARWYWLVATRL